MGRTPFQTGRDRNTLDAFELAQLLVVVTWRQGTADEHNINESSLYHSYSIDSDCRF
jgi:hypothetical protein